MNEAPLEMETKTETENDSREIVVDEVFPHAPELLWKTLTTPELMGRWLMVPTGFAPIPGTSLAHSGVVHDGT